MPVRNIQHSSPSYIPPTHITNTLLLTPFSSPSSQIVIGIISDRIKEGDCKFGFILDGFPRTLVQAKALDKMLASNGESVTKVVELNVPDSILEERICGRWIHKASGASYHVKFKPPKTMKLGPDGKPDPASMIDDTTGEKLEQRRDDTASALVKRLKEYHGSTVPILKHYAPKGITETVNANQAMDGVWGGETERGARSEGSERSELHNVMSDDIIMIS